MATNFPTSFDTFTNPSTGSALNSPSHAGQHADINDAMEAVQAKLGLTSGWTAFTPSWNNLTIGDGTDQWYYAVVNETLFITGRTTLGSTTSISGAVQMEIPYGTSIMNASQPVGSANYFESASGTNYVGFLTTLSTTTLAFREFNVSGSLITQAQVLAGSPFTWGTDDQIRATMTLRLT